jgi:anti-sigma factor RsiW
MKGRLASMDALGAYALINHQNPGQPLDITSSQPDEVGRWSKDRMPFRVAVPDLSSRGYALIGGRPCTLGKAKAVYLVYDDRGQQVSAFIVPSRDLSFAMTEGRHYQMTDAANLVEFWQEKDLVYVVVRQSPPATTPNA